MSQIEKHIFKKCKQTNKGNLSKIFITSCFYYPQPAIGLKLRLSYFTYSNKIENNSLFLFFKYKTISTLNKNVLRPDKWVTI